MKIGSKIKNDDRCIRIEKFPDKRDKIIRNKVKEMRFKFNQENNKVIGLHTFSKKSPYYNMGSFLKYAINDLNKFKNQIGIIVEVNEYDLNKEVYFLNQDQNYAGELNED